MAYICQNCGVVTEDSNNLCNPVNEEYKKNYAAILKSRSAMKKFQQWNTPVTVEVFQQILNICANQEEFYDFGCKSLYVNSSWVR
jgi:hypothetical protein